MTPAFAPRHPGFHRRRTQRQQSEEARREYMRQLDRVRQSFRDAGISITEWANAHGFARMTVVDVLRGHRAGHRGEAHRVAVALGLKNGTVVDVKRFKPSSRGAA